MPARFALRALVALVAAHALASTGCRRPPSDDETTGPAIATVSSRPGNAPATSVAARETAPGITTRDGRVTTPRPQGGGWDWTEDRRFGGGFELTEIKWRHDQAGIATLRLYAKDYDGPTDTIETLLKRDYKTYYGGVFSKPPLTSVKRIVHLGHPACEVIAEGRGADGAPLRVLERYVPTHGHLFLVSAVGDPAALDALGASLRTWFEAVRFSELPPR